MKRALLLLTATLAFAASMSFAQVSGQERRAENQTEAQNGIRDNVDVTSGPSVAQVTNHSAVLNWTTNGVAATRVNYGLDPNNLSQSAYIPGGTTNHQVMLRGLQPHSTYYFAIENKHGAGRLTGTFQTQ